MKAIILPAGQGTRISRMIEPVPKCTLPIAEVPLIRYTVNMLERYGISSSPVVGRCDV